MAFGVKALLGAVLLLLAIYENIVLASAPTAELLDASSERDSPKRQIADPLASVISSLKTNAELEAYLKDYVKRCSSIARLTTIGKSVDGFPLYVLEISDKPGIKEPEANIKFVANIHGDETLGRILTTGLAEWLCQNYKKDATAKRIVNGVHLWLLPSMNPDGFAAGTRANARGYDLNRNFPDQFEDPEMLATGHEQPEVKAVMDWILQTPFTSSISFHGGALVANYPWDGTDSPSGQSFYNPSPDDKTFVYLAKTYADFHRKMATYPNTMMFPEGITNGAEWYTIYGGMQDWNYIKAGCMEITVEVGDKEPSVSELPTLFQDNLKAMLAFITRTGFGGVSGRVMVEDTASAIGRRRRDLKGGALAPVEAEISIKGIDKVTKSNAEFGDYHRPLAPGRYTIIVKKEGYKTATAKVTIPSSGKGVVRDIVLVRL